MRPRIPTLLLLAATLCAGCKPSNAAASAHPAAASTPAATATTPTPIAERVPLLRLSEHGGWSSGILEIPAFTLYDDGLVVFARGEGEHARAMQARLSKDETYALLDRAHAALGEMPETTHLIHGRDIRSASIGVTYGGRIYSVTMHGFEEDEDQPAPEAFAALHETLASWDAPDAEPWTPDELVIAMFRVDAEPTNAWPDVLPPPPQGAREPRERVVTHGGTTIPQPIRYRVPGSLQASLSGSVPPLRADLAQDDVQALYARVIEWNGASWHVRYDRVVPERTWFW